MHHLELVVSSNLNKSFVCNAHVHIEHICWQNFSNCTYCLWPFLFSVNIVTAGFSAGEWGSQIGKIRDRVKVWRDQLDPIADASPGKLYKQAAKEHHLNDEDKIKCLPICVYVSKTPERNSSAKGGIHSSRKLCFGIYWQKDGIAKKPLLRLVQNTNFLQNTSSLGAPTPPKPKC